MTQTYKQAERHRAVCGSGCEPRGDKIQFVVLGGKHATVYVSILLNTSEQSVMSVDLKIDLI